LFRESRFPERSKQMSGWINLIFILYRLIKTPIDSRKKPERAQQHPIRWAVAIVLAVGLDHLFARHSIAAFAPNLAKPIDQGHVFLVGPRTGHSRDAAVYEWLTWDAHQGLLFLIGLAFIGSVWYVVQRRWPRWGIDLLALVYAIPSLLYGIHCSAVAPMVD